MSIHLIGIRKGYNKGTLLKELSINVSVNYMENI